MPERAHESRPNARTRDAREANPTPPSVAKATHPTATMTRVAHPKDVSRNAETPSDVAPYVGNAPRIVRCAYRWVRHTDVTQWTLKTRDAFVRDDGLVIADSLLKNGRVTRK